MTAFRPVCPTAGCGARLVKHCKSPMCTWWECSACKHFGDPKTHGRWRARHHVAQ